MSAGTVRRGLLAAVAAGALTGCAALLDPHGAVTEFSNALPNEYYANNAMSALSRGDYATAERNAISALRANPKDPLSLLTAGMVYQATGRYDLARQYYEVILANQPSAMMMVPVDGVVQPRSVVDVARVNMATVDKITGRSQPRTAAQSGRPADPIYDSMMPKPQGDPARGGATLAEANMVGRFRTLKRLLDEGLITADEFARRRAANLGALLPYSSGQPTPAGLDRPLPGEDVVVERLRALALSLENRAITPRELAVERTAILDALVPGDIRKAELPPLPPKDMLEAAAAVARAERMRAVGLVSADEAAREKEAIERNLDGTLASARVTGTMTGLRHGTPPAASSGGAGYLKAGQGVLLATLKSEDAARKAWAGMKGKFPEELAKLDATMKRVDLGEKGVRWRVLAGPLPSLDEARKLCKTLKLHRQSCDPAPFEKAK